MLGVGWTTYTVSSNMKEPDKLTWISGKHTRACLAIKELSAAKKERVSGYDERLRKLNGLADVLLIKLVDQQDELFDPKEILSPDLEKLLNAPLHGLD